MAEMINSTLQEDVLHSKELCFQEVNNSKVSLEKTKGKLPKKEALTQAVLVSPHGDSPVWSCSVFWLLE